jgi:protease-4
MKQFLITMAGVFAGLALFFIGVPFVIVSLIAAASHPAPTPASSILYLDLRGGVTDQEPQNVLSLFGSRNVAVMKVIQTLRRAEGDDRVKGLFVRLPGAGIDPGEADELRLAFRHFHDHGKFVIAHSQGLYPEGIVTSTYMLGASADQLWMQPGAPFQATGIATQDIFFKGLFDKYGITPDFQQRYEYKNAVNGYLYNDYTAAHREAELSWMGSIYDSALAAAAADRKMDPAKLKALIEAGPYEAEDAKAKGLIDQLGTVKDAEQAAAARAGDGARMESLDDYASGAGALDGGLGRPEIAVIGAEGDIDTGPSSDGLGSSQNINSGDVADALYAAADDKDIKAIVFRESSPGGSDTASEEILAAVRYAKSKKPIVFSMGTYGASGGYWIASEASAIVAEPTTLTGSIGVYGGKLVLGPALSRFGVDLRQLSVGGQYAGADDASQPFTAAQRAAFSASVDHVYAGFIQRVSQGRGIPADRVQQIARGRVWTGAQAKPLGLIDEVGGFYDAVDKAKALAGLAGQEVRLKSVTAKRSPLESIRHLFGVSQSSLKTLAELGQVLSDPHARSLIDAVADDRRRASGGDLLLAPLPRF